jgi:anti-sigma factor RsiW
MDCPQYLAQFSDYFDGRAEVEVSEEMEAHRFACQRCRRYSEVLEAGGKLLRDLPSPEIPPDFQPRLDHRIFHVEDGASIAREAMGTGATTVSVLAVALLVALSAWAPAVTSPERTIELPPVVVAGPPPAAFISTGSHPTFPRNRSFFGNTEFQDGIWGDPHALLREYSPILERRRTQALVRVGVE